MLIEIDDGERPFADLRFRRDLNQMEIGPEEIQYLSGLEAEMRTMLRSHQAEYIDSGIPVSRRDWIISQVTNNFSNAVNVVDIADVYTDSPVAELDRLMTLYAGDGV
jgi:hypothetical protein